MRRCKVSELFHNVGDRFRRWRRTEPSGKRLPLGMPRKSSAVSDSMRPSTMTCATCTDLGPYSRATDCEPHTQKPPKGQSKILE